MNYQYHYHLLIEKAKNRSDIDVYMETHHIVPRCLGGSDHKDNLVALTAREHFVAHQLLAKIYPTHLGLQFAMRIMCAASKFQIRNNREYAWIRKSVAMALSTANTGTGNGMYGKTWDDLYGKDIADSRKQVFADRFAQLASARKGKTLDSIYGEKADTVRSNMSVAKKGKSWDAIYGNEVATAKKEAITARAKGKTWEELYDVDTVKAMRKKAKAEKSEETKLKMSEARKAYWAKKRGDTLE